MTKPAADRPLEIELSSPDDFHVHFRDGAMLQAVAPYTTAQFARALVMPNTYPPIRTVEEAREYRSRILKAIPASQNSKFEPLMTLYLTEQTTVRQIEEAHSSGFVVACKLYPAGATTLSSHGVKSLEKVTKVLGAMQKLEMVLCVHGESTRTDIDVFAKEEHFVRTTLPKLLSDYPSLRIVLEHVTTSAAVAIVQSTPGNRLAATITPHHLLYSRNALFANAKLHPDMYCLPLLKTEQDRKALLNAVANDSRGLFFAGTDSAPHLREAKQCENGCAGIFNAPAAVELYAQAFEEANALQKLRAFLSENGAKFYRLPVNDGRAKLVRRKRSVPELVPVRDSAVRPLCAGATISWSLSRG